MSDVSSSIDVTLLGRSYRFACKESERRELLEAVDFLDRRLREIKDAGKVTGAERVAVMAALNMAHELLQAKSALPPSFATGEAQKRVSAMRQAIDKALAEQEKLF